MRRTGLIIIAAMLAIIALPHLASARDFALEDFFAGRSVADGEFKAINGVDRKFRVALTGRWNGKRLTLREDFVYADGVRERKTWRFVKTAPGRYSGTREDVVGPAEVTINGDVARYSYLVDIAPGPKQNIVRFHDTIRRQPDGRLLNTAWVSKFGFPVATVRVTFSKK
jgi:hypothetical protein